MNNDALDIYNQSDLLKQSWIQKSATQEVIKCFKKANIPFRFVGGCVRDSLLKKPIKDIDLCTPAEPSTIIKLFRDNNFGVYETGLAHGTVTVFIEHQPYEITTLRYDKKTDGRHATVEFTNNWRADAARRDFTFNALSLDTEGKIYDYFQGYPDLIKGVVRFIGNPLDRILEDHLRILRLFRFQAYYGKQPIPDTVLTLVKKHAKLVAVLSGERIREEFFKIILTPSATSILKHLVDTEVIQQFIPAAIIFEKMQALVSLEQHDSLQEHITGNPIRRLAILFDNIDINSLNQLGQRLKLSNQQKRELKEYLNYPQTIGYDTFSIRQLLYDFGAERLVNFFLLQCASDISRQRANTVEAIKRIKALYDINSRWVKPVFPINGNDLIKHGIPHGPEIGVLLNKIHNWWRKNDFNPNYQSCLEYLKEIQQ